MYLPYIRSVGWPPEAAMLAAHTHTYCTYVRTYVHTYIRTYIHTHNLEYIPTYLPTPLAPGMSLMLEMRTRAEEMR